VCRFFEKFEEVNPFTKETETNYRIKEGQGSYWDKRARKEWSDLPDLF